MTLPATFLKVRVSGGTPTAAETNRIQDNVGTLLNEVAAVPILGAVQLVDVLLAATPTNVPHGLGRAWTNFAITSKNANQDVWFTSRTNDAAFLTLTATGAVTVNLLVW